MEASRSNALIHQLYVRQEYDECLKLVDSVLAETGGQCEHAIYVKALIERHRGRIADSLRLFQQATALNPHNVGRSLALLGKHSQAIEVYDEAQKLAGHQDWELWHAKGLCHAQLEGGHEAALECFAFANAIQPNDATYQRISELHAARGDHGPAAAALMEALEHSPDSADLLASLGLLLLRSGDAQRAFDQLGTSLLHEPRGARAILADHGDHDAALVKYRVVAAVEPDCPQLWNNAGAAFYGKQRYIAAIACLKRAAYLAPLEWVTAYNLGLAHLATGQAASAFHHLSAAVNLRPDFAPRQAGGSGRAAVVWAARAPARSYGLMGVALARLDDPDNARAAYARAAALDPGEPSFRLNHAVLLHSLGDAGGAAAQLGAYWEAAAARRGAPDAEEGCQDPDAAEAAGALARALGLAVPSGAQ
ncbi:hypothetical protein Rsub_01991 [Raphidocelis subcapitata]|uniref:Uncharacterized protein n=1 Tax=Raphidocelis subcapitata TaxID=307507 RepID=A0A2V0NQ66_9CHLO|nr:hypothetical protein Rsub_01991 [Raphidocelis subcapitata]|eukprot:GBF89419.1 hypothetical protein Rsub_01991 [Raphidocelis subcapitata]